MKLSLIAATAILVWFSELTSPASVRHPDYGVCTQPQFLEGVPLQHTRELGVGAVRIDLPWSLFVDSSGVLGSGDPRVDGWINNAHTLGLHIFATLGGPPADAKDCLPKEDCAPRDLRQWNAYVRHVLARFSHLGSDITFGIWNEPDIGNHHISVATYGELFTSADDARMAVNPSARLAGPETSHGAESDGYFDDVLALMQPRLRPQDVISVHWYPPAPPSPNLSDYMGRIISRIGMRQVWLTETGEKEAVDDAQRSKLAMTVDAFNRRKSPQWAKFFVFRLYNDEVDIHDLYNLVRTDLMIRSAFEMYRDSMFRIFTVSLQAANGRYLRAAGQTVPIRASSDTAGQPETFELYDFNGGSLQDGDLIRIRIKSDNGQFLRVAGRTRPLLADDNCGCTDEGLFVVGSPATGQLTLKSFATGEFASLDGGRAADILVNRTSAGARETFTVVVH